jgi:hypothetical protein
MVYFQTNFGIFWMALEVKFSTYFMTIGYTLWPFALFNSLFMFCGHLLDFGILHQEKSGNPARNLKWP